MFLAGLLWNQIEACRSTAALPSVLIPFHVQGLFSSGLTARHFDARPRVGEGKMTSDNTCEQDQQFSRRGNVVNVRCYLGPFLGFCLHDGVNQRYYFFFDIL